MITSLYTYRLLVIKTYIYIFVVDGVIIYCVLYRCAYKVYYSRAVKHFFFFKQILYREGQNVIICFTIFSVTKKKKKSYVDIRYDIYVGTLYIEDECYSRRNDLTNIYLFFYVYTEQ